MAWGESSLFQGTVVRSFAGDGKVFREFFQWFDRDDVRNVEGNFIGDEVVDSSDCEGAAKLGPALIYRRDLPFEGIEALKAYFDGNDSVKVDTVRRATRAEILWPSEEEMVQGFRQQYGNVMFEQDFRSDPVWGPAAERGTAWYTARAVVAGARGPAEILSWVSEHPSVKDEVLIEAVKGELVGHGLEVVENLIELFDTHFLGPQSGSIIFEIARQKRESREQYVQKFVKVARRDW